MHADLRFRELNAFEASTQAGWATSSKGVYKRWSNTGGIDTLKKLPDEQREEDQVGVVRVQGMKGALGPAVYSSVALEQSQN